MAGQIPLEAAMSGAYAAGRIVNPKAAKSQLMGGQIWGVAAAPHEATEIDRRAARYTNSDLAGHLIPMDAVFHATGVRVGRPPIQAAKLLDASDLPA